MKLKRILYSKKKKLFFEEHPDGLIVEVHNKDSVKEGKMVQYIEHRNKMSPEELVWLCEFTKY